MATLNDFVELVRGQLRDSGDTPAFARAVLDEGGGAQTDELEQFVRSAIADYSGYRPLHKPGLLAVVASHSVYSMPPDFLGMVQFPMPGYVISGTMLYLSPAPTQSQEAAYWYKALHMSETIPASDHPPIVWLASALALRAIAAEPQKMKRYASYKIPEVLETSATDVAEFGKDLLRTANDYERQYLGRVNTEIEQQAKKPKPFVTFG